MPWKEVTEMTAKEDFVKLAQQKGANISALCKAHGISRKTGYKLLKRFEEAGKAGLIPQSRRPKHSPLKTNKEVEKRIIETRLLYPKWGGDKLRQYLVEQGHQEMPTEKTIDRILKRHGLISAEESEKHKAWVRFEHEAANDLWQMDFKGHFATGSERCHPLTLLDDHSRYSLLIKACPNERMETVKPELIKVFREYGLPLRMTMDNGGPWGCSRAQRFTQLSAWLIRIGIKVSHSRPKHPQTQGKLERFHRTLKQELLSAYHFADLKSAQEGFDWWRTIYNEQRPHAAIELGVPAKRYKKSARIYPEVLPTVEYDNSFAIRKVQCRGEIYFNGKEYKVGEAFYGSSVGLKETEVDGIMDVYFCHQKVVKIDLRYPYK